MVRLRRTKNRRQRENRPLRALRYELLEQRELLAANLWGAGYAAPQFAQDAAQLPSAFYASELLAASNKMKTTEMAGVGAAAPVDTNTIATSLDKPSNNAASPLPAGSMDMSLDASIGGTWFEIIPIELVGSELRIIGSDIADDARVWSSSYLVYAELNGERESFASWTVDSIYFVGYGGNDTFLNDTSIDSLAYGGSGNDRLTGGTGEDTFYGDGGRDILNGRGGDDTIWAGSGDDSLYGGDGGDLLHGDAGNDVIHAGSGIDYAYGDDGNDTIYAGSGNDRVYGGDGEDRLLGGSGSDIINGGDDDDLLYGHSGVDWLYGGGGDDTLRGGNDRDRLYGNAGRDRLFGETGDDRLYGGSGRDHLYGGSGTDRLYGGSGRDTLVSLDSANTDRLFGQSGFDSFWLDDGDLVLDATSSEASTNLHRISRFENGADRTLNGDNIADPTDRSFYKDFSARPLFADDGPSVDDIDQNALGDCYFMSSMGAMAHTNQNAVYQTVVDLGDGTYAVRFDGDQFYRVDADLPTTRASSWAPVYAGLGIDNSLWAAICEKAYTHHREGANTYASIEGGWGYEALAALNASGTGNRNINSYSSGQSILNDIANRFEDGLAMTCGFTAVPAGSPVVASHSYTVTGINRDASGRVISVTLRNPWGPFATGGTFVTMTGSDLTATEGKVCWGNVG